MFDNPILKILMDRYGHIEDIDQLFFSQNLGWVPGDLASISY